MFPEYPKNPLKGIEKKTKKLLDANRKKINSLLTIKEKNFNNFMKPYQALDAEIEILLKPLFIENSVNNSTESQKAYSEVLPLITDYSTELSQNEGVYRSMKEIYENDILSEEQKVLLEREIKEYELEGIDRAKKIKNKIKKINLELSELSRDFTQNVIDATGEYELIIEKEEDVKGMPKHELKAAEIKDKKSKDEKPAKKKYRFTLQAPSYMAYMTYGPNARLRKKLHKAYTTRAPENSRVINKILKLRQEKAQILGFKNYAEYSIARKMAPSSKTVVNFLDDLIKKGKEPVKNEIKKIKEFARDKGYKDIQIWDLSYISNLYKKEKLNIDDEMLKPYFEKNRVINGLIEFLEKLFQIQFEEVEAPHWHESVKVYDLKENDKVFSRIYMDMESRKEKRQGAWMDSWTSHSVDEHGKEIPASAYIVGNFPAAADGLPSLLKHDDVVTLFHEMGHAIHHLFSRTTEYFNSGVNGVAWDVVEFPSQFLENFAYDKKVLQLFAYHYETNEPLPESEIEKIQDVRYFMAAYQLLRQMEFAMFDMKLHQKAAKGKEVMELLNKIRKKTRVIKAADYERFENQFGHIFGGGYAAGYYSYKWAEGYAADAYLYFVENGIFDEEIAREFKKNIFEKGSSDNMDVLFQKFMGREMDVNKLLELSRIH